MNNVWESCQEVDLTRLILVLSSSIAHLFLELNFSNVLSIISLSIVSILEYLTRLSNSQVPRITF